ncbi:MAG TPA: hypothetical protein VNA30_02300 [Mycobacteriales bacterium]|nr:hypothetical protein [Mycobacteriales bacterium]
MRARTHSEQLRHETEILAKEVFADPDFQKGMAQLRASAEETSRRCAAEAVTLAALAAQLLHYPGDSAAAALEHYGWTPARTPTATIWISPGGQVLRVPHDDHPQPPLSSG